MAEHIMDMDMNEKSDTCTLDQYSSIMKHWSIKSQESFDYNEYKDEFSDALVFEQFRNYEVSKFLFESCYDFAKDIGDLAGVTECVAGLMSIAEKEKNPTFMREVEQKIDTLFKIFDQIPSADFCLMRDAAKVIATSRFWINQENYEKAEPLLLEALKKMKTLDYGANIAMCYRLLWNLALVSSDSIKSNFWLHKSLEAYQTLGDHFAMKEMCKDVHPFVAVPPDQAMKMTWTIKSFMATGSNKNPA